MPNSFKMNQIREKEKFNRSRISSSRCNIGSYFLRRLPSYSCHRDKSLFRAKMYLQFYINENGDKVYTTKKESPLGLATQSAHPARFSPDDKFSRQRVLLKKRFGLLPTQKPPKKY
ncbi:hypothetical protein L1987_03896 [Smallanthus sonchifolius]|uniref:Uncharacterized protein n=1 Tax=Smallanthus sonchifolius TaxID=185202 RepID=A0ACB9KC02_9ASTR|nr:hypothetical protein L1987_03896 [Smallanthus sonchifolius]